MEGWRTETPEKTCLKKINKTIKKIHFLIFTDTYTWGHKLVNPPKHLPYATCANNNIYHLNAASFLKKFRSSHRRPKYLCELGAQPGSRHHSDPTNMVTPVFASEKTAQKDATMWYLSGQNPTPKNIANLRRTGKYHIVDCERKLTNIYNKQAMQKKTSQP